MGLSQTTAKTQEGEKAKTQEPCAAEAMEDLVP